MLTALTGRLRPPRRRPSHQPHRGAAAALGDGADLHIEAACQRLDVTLTAQQLDWVRAALAGRQLYAPDRTKIGWTTAHRVTLEALALRHADPATKP